MSDKSILPRAAALMAGNGVALLEAMDFVSSHQLPISAGLPAVALPVLGMFAAYSLMSDFGEGLRRSIVLEFTSFGAILVEVAFWLVWQYSATPAT